jgi:hypothetical protein
MDVINVERKRKPGATNILVDYDILAKPYQLFSAVACVLLNILDTGETPRRNFGGNAQVCHDTLGYCPTEYFASLFILHTFVQHLIVGEEIL